ncbi:MAG TPA: putative baseplate assembly protein [Bryobacteraceae bacterium]|nr:putative baseplate assembly protein [Bryobacteraceae bacterium]
MPLPDIQLDDRTFEDLTQELQRRIPAYTPEWTDFNESDPGIALIELFAWLEEILIYRLNKIPDKAYIKLLNLIGIQLNPPAPAHAELTFTLTSKDLSTAVLIGGGTQVGLANASSGPPIIFETTDDLYAVGADVAAVQTFDGARYQVVTEFNRLDGSSYFAFGQFPQANAALYIGLDRAYPTAGSFQYPLTIHVDTSGGSGDVQSGAQGAPPPPVVAVLEYWNGAGWQQVTVVQDGTNALTQSGVILFLAPANPVAVQYGALRKSSDPALFWIRFRIDQVLGPGYEAPPQITNILVNTISAINAVSHQQELIGASNGLPNQTFQISNIPVLPKDPSVVGIIDVDEGDGNGFTLWTEVQDFAAADRNSKFYTLDYPTGVVGFGDGINGKIPHWLSSDGSNRQPADVPNIRVTAYRSGGGAAGNAGSNSITSLIDAIPFVAGVANLLPSTLGADEETLADAENRAPLSVRTLGRAVSVDDFAALAKQTPGARIARATAIPLLRPRSQIVRAADGTVPPQTPAPGVVTVLVVPGVPGVPSPQANDQTLAAVAQYLDKYRLVTCELHVARPIYRKVEIQAHVIVDPNFVSGVVAAALQNALLAFYNPLPNPIPGGPNPTGWGFGATIFFSDAYGQILNVKGVQRIENLKIFVDGQPQTQDTDIPLQPDELVYSTNHTLDVSYQ